MFYAIDDLVFEVSMRMRFLEATKNIIEHLWTLDNWYSPWALYIDDFGLSDFTPIEIYKKEIQQTDAQTIIYGTILDEEENCTPGYVFTTQFEGIASSGIHPYDTWLNQKTESFIDYMRLQYGPTIASGNLI